MIVKESLRFLGVPLRKSRELHTNGPTLDLYQPTSYTRSGLSIDVGAQTVYVRELNLAKTSSSKSKRSVRLPTTDHVFRQHTRLPGMYHLFKRVK